MRVRPENGPRDVDGQFLDSGDEGVAYPRPAVVTPDVPLARPYDIRQQRLSQL